MKTLSAIIIITFFSAAVFAQAGMLDSTFGGDGKVTTAIGLGNDDAFSIAIQSDGKIVAAGRSFNGTNYDFALVRYNVDGNLDSSFGNEGKVTTDIDSNDNQANAVAIQHDGKIVAAGWWSTIDWDVALIRYNTDGALDTTFGINGIVLTSISSIVGANSVLIQPEGKIVVAGSVYNGQDWDFALVRYTIGGTLDSTFGMDGIVTTDFDLNFDVATSLAIQFDGKIVAAGYSTYSGDFTDADFALARYNMDGTLDTGFSADGKVITDISGGDEANAISIQPDGKILASGYAAYFYLTDKPDFASVRYNTDGALDNSFGTNGIVTTSFGSGYNVAYSVATQSDGKIVAAGISSFNFDWEFALVRYNNDGSLDSSFGIDGIVATVFGSTDDEAYSMTLQSDGKILVAGYSFNGTNDDIALARYLSGLNVGILNFSCSQSSPLIYPNPIHQTETLEYTLTQNEVLTLTLYDVNGREVKTFFTQQKRNNGSHKEQLNFGELPSGNYFLTLSNGGQMKTVKVVKQ